MLTNQLEQMMEAQKQQLEPVLKWNAYVAQAFETVARKNYEVAGDCLDFVVKQSQVPAQEMPVQDMVADYVGGARAFGEKMAERSAEYVEMTKEISEAAPVPQQAAAV